MFTCLHSFEDEKINKLKIKDRVIILDVENKYFKWLIGSIGTVIGYSNKLYSKIYLDIGGYTRIFIKDQIKRIPEIGERILIINSNNEILKQYVGKQGIIKKKREIILNYFQYS